MHSSWNPLPYANFRDKNRFYHHLYCHHYVRGQYAVLLDFGKFVHSISQRKTIITLTSVLPKMQTHSQSYGRVSERKGSEADRGGGDGMARAMQKVEKLVEENAVVVFSESGCCMCHVVKRLFCSLGVGPTVYELDEQSGGADMEKALMRLEGKTTAVPTVFVGGKLLGGLDTVMASHLSGNLVPRLKEAGALWL